MGRYGAAFVAGAVIGGVAGTAVTLWRAPQAGRITRAQLGEQLRSHAGPAAGLVGVAGDGLNAAGLRLTQAVTLATRFVEELIHPTEAVEVPRPATTTPTRVTSAPTTSATTTAPAGGDALSAGEAATGRTAPDAATSSGATAAGYRPAAMTTTASPGSGAAGNVTAIADRLRQR